MADLYLATMGMKKLNDKRPVIKRETFIDITNTSNIVSVGLMVIAGWLAWRKNEGESTLFRIILTIVAVMFATIYLIYYFIYYYLMGSRPWNISQKGTSMGGLYGGAHRSKKKKTRKTRKTRKSGRKSKKRSRKSK